MEVIGIKPGTQQPPRDGPKLAIGERLSLCGQFAINGHGQWRELSKADCSQQRLEFEGIMPDGKPMPNDMLR